MVHRTCIVCRVRAHHSRGRVVEKQAKGPRLLTYLPLRSNATVHLCPPTDERNEPRTALSEVCGKAHYTLCCARLSSPQPCLSSPTVCLEFRGTTKQTSPQRVLARCSVESARPTRRLAPSLRRAQVGRGPPSRARRAALRSSVRCRSKSQTASMPPAARVQVRIPSHPPHQH